MKSWKIPKISQTERIRAEKLKIWREYFKQSESSSIERKRQEVLEEIERRRAELVEKMERPIDDEKRRIPSHIYGSYNLSKNSLLKLSNITDLLEQKEDGQPRKKRKMEEEQPLAREHKRPRYQL